MKIKNTIIFNKLVVWFLLFSMVVGVFSSDLDVVYAKNKTKGTCYLFLVEDDSLVKNLGVTDSSHAEILVINVGKDYDYGTLSKNSAYQTALEHVGKYSHGAVVFLPNTTNDIPTNKPYTSAGASHDKNNQYHLTMKTIKGSGSDDTHYGTYKANKIASVISNETGLNKASIKIIFTLPYPVSPTGSNSINKYNVIRSENNCFKKQLQKKKVDFSVVDNTCNDYTNLSVLVSKLKSKDKTTFQYLGYGDKIDKKGNLASSDSSGDSSGDTDKDAKIEFKNTKEVFDKCGKTGDDKHIKYLESYAVFLYGQNYSKATIAGILGNAMKETGVDPKYSGGTYCGMFCFTPNMFSEKYVKKCSHSKFTAHNGKPICADGSCQIIMAAEALGTNAKGAYGGQQSKLNDFLTNYKASGKYTVPKKLSQTIKSLDDYKKLDSPEDAAMLWMLCFERNKGIYLPTNQDGCQAHPDQQSGTYTYRGWFEHEFNNNKNGRPYMAKVIADWLGSSAFDNVGQESIDKAAKMAEEAQKKGYLTEEELSAWTKIVNEKFINYKGVTRDSLSQSDLNSLNSWEQNVNYDDIENHGIFKYFRYVFMFIAIMMMVYSVLLYCCYWFDKVNPFFDISLLFIVTFGKLTAAPTDEEVNYTVQDFFKNNKGKSKFVNHKYMIVVCLSLIFFSLMILTGSIYKIIFSIITWISRVFGI